jgi:2-methylcitrate dehydratase PrpD
VTISERLSDWILGLTFDQLPASAVESAKKLVLDHIGVSVVGAAKPWSQAVRSVVSRRGGAPESSVYFAGQKLPATSAALINGAYGHAFEFDDHLRSVHPGCIVIPTALALAEQRGGADGRAFLTAIVAGYEVLTRLGAAMGGISAAGHHPTGTMGAFGAVPAAARLLRLTREQCVWALGLAGNFPTGVNEFIHGSVEKRVFAGRAAEAGILACQLAAEGFSGPQTIFEGEFGFCRSFSRQPKPERLLEGLGTRFQVDEVHLKWHPSAGAIAGYIDAAAGLVARHPSFFEGRMQGLELRIEGDAEELSRRSELHVRDVMGAQYSAPAVIALTIALGRAPLPGDLTDAVIRSEAVQGLLGKFQVVKRDGHEGHSRLTISRADGEMLSTDVRETRKAIVATTPDEVRGKFLRVTDGLLDALVQESVIACCDGLDEAPDVRPLAALLASAP